MDLHLRGKNVLITGGSKGIGGATAEAFAEEGSNVHLAARSTKAMQALAERLRSAHQVNIMVHTVVCVNQMICIGSRAKLPASIYLSTMLVTFPAVRSTRLTRRHGVTPGS
jgi:NAD(P)-dependent dehydrogenase (short-subunit alcohol dehydrogenase family)